MATVVAQPQGSRAGLITTVVILAITTVLMSVLFFQRDSDLRKANVESADYRKKVAEVIPEATLGTDDYHNLKETAHSAGESVYDLLNAQKADLATVIVGSPAADARERGQAAINQANAVLTAYAEKANMKTPGGTTLINTFDRWPLIASRLVEERDGLKKQLAADADEKAKADAARVAELKAKDDEIAAAKAETAKTMESVQAVTKKTSDDLASVQTTAASTAAAQAAQVQQTLQLNAGLTTTVASLNAKVARLQQTLRRFKLHPETKEDIVRVPDGIVTTVAEHDFCFINLGAGDQIVAGMTFEVYDPNKGIPPVNDNTTASTPVVRRSVGAAALAGVPGAAASKNDDRYDFELPKGKGSIEVISVGPGHSSQCRIIHTEENQPISPGDLIANLVYDKNIKYNFVVYGDFDMSNSTNANSRVNDTSVINRLITQWGGRVQPILDPAKPQDAITPDTDFLIVGREPRLPIFTADELNDPANKAQLDRAQAKLDAYRKMFTQAEEYGIPVLNQNRFLYYVGYFDSRTR